MNRYKITLQPIDWFFFGGEQTFDNGVSQSFIARSNRIPQQTTLLGMVRYQLLKKAELLPITVDNAAAVKALIGPSSFNIDKTTNSFGSIRSLSPVFIEKGKRRLVPVPLNYGYTCAFDSKTRIWLSGKEDNGIINATSKDGKNYDDKDYWKKNNYGLLIDQGGNTLEADSLYLAKMQIGITKGAERDDNKKGFFKQETLRFKDRDTRFAFYLELEGDNLIDNDFVFIGAQRSCFKMEVSTSDEQPVVPSHESNTILLLSPTFVDDADALNRLTRFHWSYGISFRNLVVADHGNLKSGSIAYNRHNNVITMLAPGSVLFCNEDDKEELKTLLTKPHLQTIGYNTFDIL